MSTIKGMKGKGKGERGGKMPDDCPLLFPSLKSVDHARLCPRYTAVSGRSRDVDCVGIEEVDLLQTELETLLAAAAKRMRLLQSELQLLDNWADKGPSASTATISVAGSKDKAFAATAAAASAAAPSSASSIQQSLAASEPTASPAVPVTGGKRSGKGKNEEKPAKRMRTDSGRATYAQPSPSKSKGKLQNSKSAADGDSPSVSAESQRSTVTVEPVAPAPTGGRILSKNLTPNRFWALVEPYCAEITPDDLQYLEDQIKACEDIGEYMKIPSLGRHYVEKWAEEDLAAERDAGKVGDRRKNVSGPGMSNGSADPLSMLRRADDGADDDSSPFGPLTQRLIQGLLEENLVTPLDDTNSISDADAVEAATVSPRVLAKQLHLGNTATLERRIRRELEEIGVFGADDEKADDASGEDDDEILAELKKKQAELRALSHQNVLMLRHLHKQAKEEMQQQELRKKMATIDAEIIEAYRKVQASKLKKKSPTKKEKESFYKALKDREVLAKQLERSESK